MQDNPRNQQRQNVKPQNQSKTLTGQLSLSSYQVQNQEQHLKKKQNKRNSRVTPKRITKSSQKNNQKKLAQNLNIEQKKSRTLPLQISHSKSIQKQVFIINSKVQKKHIDQSGQKQSKLNNFLAKKDKISQSVSFSSFSKKPNQLKRNALQFKLKKTQIEIQQLKKQSQVFAQKYDKLYWQTSTSKLKQYKILINRLYKIFQQHRRAKGQINPNIGYYTTSTILSKDYIVEGYHIQKLKKQVQQNEKIYRQLLNKKRSKMSGQQKDAVHGQIQYIKRERVNLDIDLKGKVKQYYVYKSRIWLAQREKTCYCAVHEWEIINQRYLPWELLKKGIHGEIYKGYDLQTHSTVTMKIMYLQPENASEQTKNKFINQIKKQIQILKTLNHPNIVKTIDQFQIQQNMLCFITEYCQGPQLKYYLHQRKPLEEKQAKGIMKQIAYALKYMYEHKNRVIHNDLKPNSVIFHYGLIKITDFGLCKRLNFDDEQTQVQLSNQKYNGIMCWYLPPQSFDEETTRLNFNKVDVWSLGVIFYQMLFGVRPFGQGYNRNNTFQNDGDGIYPNYKLEFPIQNQAKKKFNVSDQAKQFIVKCLLFRVSERLSPTEVYNHQYVKL